MDDKVTISDETVKIGLAIAEFINGGNDASNEELKKVDRREIKVNRRKNKESQKVPGKSENTVS